MTFYYYIKACHGVKMTRSWTKGSKGHGVFVLLIQVGSIQNCYSSLKKYLEELPECTRDKT